MTQLRAVTFDGAPYSGNIPPAIESMSRSSVVIDACFDALHQSPGMRRQRQQACVIRIDRCNAEVTVDVLVEKTVAWREPMSVAEWEAAAMQRGLYEHFDVPYILHCVTPCIRKAFGVTVLPTTDVYPPHVYQPDGQWKLVDHPEVARGARLRIGAIVSTDYRECVVRLLEALWFLQIEHVHLLTPVNDP